MDGQLQGVIDELFPQYDKNGSGTLDAKELPTFFNDAFKRLGYKITVTQEQADQSVQFIDKNSDKQVSKPEIFTAMKDIVSKRKPSQQPSPTPIPSAPPTPPPTNPSWNQPANNNWNQPPQQQQHNTWEQPPNTNWGQQPPSSNNWQSPSSWEQPANNWGQQPQPGNWNQPGTGGWNQPSNWNSGSSNDGWRNTQFYSAEDNNYKYRIDSIYRMFDRDHSGTLDARYLVKAFNHLLREMGVQMTINQIQARYLLSSIDSSEDGRIEKSEFLQMLKYLLQQQPGY